MAIDESGSGIRGRRPSNKGVAYSAVINGVEVLKAWPRSRGKNLHPKTLAQMEYFRQVQKAFKYSAAEVQISYMEAVARTPLLPRDLFLMASSGRMHSIIDENGHRWWSVAAVKNISDSLDVIAQLPGQMLVRASAQWQPLQPPALSGLVLTSTGPSSPPQWTNGGIPVVVVPWWWAPPTVAALPLYSVGAGNTVTIANDPDAGLLVSGTPGAPHDGLGVYSQALTPGASGNWRCEAHINASFSPVNYRFIGVAALETSSGKWARIGIGYSGAYSLDQSYGTLDAWVNGIGAFPFVPVLQLHIALEFDALSGLITVQISADGKTWSTTGSIIATTVFDVEADQIGVGCAPNAGDDTPDEGSCDRFIITYPV